MELDTDSGNSESEQVQEPIIQNEVVPDKEPTKTDQILIPTDTKKKPSKSKVKALFKKSKKPVKTPEDEQEEEVRSGFKDVSLNYHETNLLRANLGLKPLQ